MTSSRIFTGFRALGFTTNDVPLCTRYNQKHKENYVVTCVGKAFHTYNCSKLGIISVSDSHPEDITCIAVDSVFVFTGCRNTVRAFLRGKGVAHTYEGHTAKVHLLLPFGHHLISIDENSCVKIWDINSQELYAELEFQNSSFQIVALLHPSTYLNKVLFGSKQGTLQLWNVRSNRLLYTFKGWGNSITALEQAPAVDVVAVGLADGTIYIHNIKYDESILNFRQDWGPVTAICFRTDGQAVMATGSTLGHIALWNLKEKKLKSQIRDAHRSTITGMKCLPSEPLMITSSPDNSLKVWIFDQPDGGGRLLRQREGHSAPPTSIRFHGNNGENILSAGQDSTLRSFSTVHDNRNKNLGRASYNKTLSKKVGLKRDQHMMPPITDIASESSKQSDWDSIVACHRDETLVTTWNYSRSTMGAHKLEHPRFKDDIRFNHIKAQCLDVSSCGNFTVIGYSSGHVDMYNLQSGIYRGSYGTPEAHKGPVRGVSIDGLNQITVTAGADCLIKFWKFKNKDFLDQVQMECQVAKIRLHRESSMLAVALDDFRIAVVDVETRRVVRLFQGHRGSITDMTFSRDSRWLITASMDSSIRTWDLPTGRLVDCFVLDAAVTSLTMSQTDSFLATTHVDDLGVYLWSNMTLYKHVSLRPLPADFEPSLMELPATANRFSGTVSDTEDLDEEAWFDEAEFRSPEQITQHLVTLSMLPNSRWQNLLHLDIIKQRNKPREPPKVPKSAPFFLPTIAGIEPKFATPEDEKKEKEQFSVSTSWLEPATQFGKVLLGTVKSKEYDTVMEMFKEMGPSQVDVELRSLAPEGGGSIELMAQFFVFIDHTFKTNRDFELAQAYLGLFLKLHGDTIASNPELVEQAKMLQQSQQEAWLELQDMFNQSLCLVNYLRSATL